MGKLHRRSCLIGKAKFVTIAVYAIVENVLKMKQKLIHAKYREVLSDGLCSTFTYNPHYIQLTRKASLLLVISSAVALPNDIMNHVMVCIPVQRQVRYRNASSSLLHVLFNSRT